MQEIASVVGRGMCWCGWHEWVAHGTVGVGISRFTGSMLDEKVDEDMKQTCVSQMRVKNNLTK
jgi:hypothetical protein